MGNTKAILGILSTALSLWKSKEARKYIDEKIKLEKKWYVEFNKPVRDPYKDPDEGDYRSNAVIDVIDSELLILCNNVSSAVRAENPGT